MGSFHTGDRNVCVRDLVEALLEGMCSGSAFGAVALF